MQTTLSVLSKFGLHQLPFRLKGLHAYINSKLIRLVLHILEVVPVMWLLGAACGRIPIHQMVKELIPPHCNSSLHTRQWELQTWFQILLLFVWPAGLRALRFISGWLHLWKRSADHYTYCANKSLCPGNWRAACYDEKRAQPEPLAILSCLRLALAVHCNNCCSIYAAKGKLRCRPPKLRAIGWQSRPIVCPTGMLYILST